MVERGPEKAGVGGSIPSLATTNQRAYGNRPEKRDPHATHNTSLHNSEAFEISWFRAAFLCCHELVDDLLLGRTLRPGDGLRVEIQRGADVMVS